MSIVYCHENEDLIDTDYPNQCEDCAKEGCSYNMNESNYEIKILIECKVCERLIEKDEAYEAFTNEYVCDPDIDERCLGTWNKENYNPHDEL